ncbi:rapamycin-insensitive companion of mTOR-like [Grus japonensis]|uniref:Rapamycin-insensitive companion of mTOR-like n=1 Tax=Grus japonensis TaxID=30415 RepID=A0ABC9YHQ5_GRUJA
MITVNASLFPSSITNSLIAVGNDGLQERDRMVRACIAIICELALQNPEVVALRGGLSTILKNVIDCHLSRINEALITTVLHLINHPKTRQYVRADVELERILAPYTDFHYRHNPDTAEGQLKEDREARFLASKMGIVAAFRSWAGIISLCKPGNSGIQSLIGVLCIPNMEIRQGLLEVLYDIFRLPLPVVAEEFIEALLSVDPSRFQDCWRLSDGFVAAEAKTILPHRARSRPDLMDNYLALVLSAFITNGLLEGLVEVITSSDDHVSVRATILLGELLHMDTEEALVMNLRDSQVLNHKENLEWNWNLIGTILKWPNVNLRNYKDEQLHRFVRRLLYFYKPSSKLYANLDLDYAKAKQLTVVGCQFTEFLLESEEDGQGYLEELVKDIVNWLNSSSGIKLEHNLQNNGLLNTLSQHYFLFFGTLSCHPHGVKMLEKCNVFQCLLNLCSLKNQDHLLKLTVSSLDYSRDGLARVILSKILTAATDEGEEEETKQNIFNSDAGKPPCSITSLKCLYTNARSTGNKQEELEICVQSQSHELVAITETWWDSSHDWNAVMDGYVLFRKDRPARRGGGVALYVREQLECIDLRLGVDEERMESLWVRTEGQANMGDTVVGVYYRPPDQEEEVDEAFYRQLEVASQSQALVVMGDFHHPDICWKGNTARHAQSRRFLQSIDDNFLTQVVEEPTRRGVLLDLVLTNKEGLVGDVKVGGSLGCSDHEMVEFRILRGRSRAISRITTLDFRRGNFGLFKDLLGRIPWVRALEGRGCPRDLVNIQALLPPSSRSVHPEE